MPETHLSKQLVQEYASGKNIKPQLITRSSDLYRLSIRKVREKPAGTRKELQDDLSEAGTADAQRTTSNKFTTISTVMHQKILEENLISSVKKKEKTASPDSQ